MAKKRRTKKHSRRARDQRLFSNVRAWVWESEPADGDNDFMLHIEKKALLFGWSTLSDRRMIDNLFEVSRNWVICGRALVTNGDKIWMEQADMTLPSCKLLEISDAYSMLRKEVLAANQERQVFDCGWIAQTWLGNDPSETDPDWVYHDAPPQLAPERVPSGLGYTSERHERWQLVNERERKKNGQANTSND